MGHQLGCQHRARLVQARLHRSWADAELDGCFGVGKTKPVERQNRLALARRQALDRSAHTAAKVGDLSQLLWAGSIVSTLVR